MDVGQARETSLVGGRYGLVALLALGLLVVDLWCDVMGHSPGTAPASNMVWQNLTNGRVFWSLSFLICCSLMVAFPQAMERIERSGDIAVPLVACVGTVLYAWTASFGAPIAVLGAALIVVNGICYGWIEVRLLAECARLGRFTDAVWAIAASQALKMPLTAAIGALPLIAQVNVDAALPLVLLPVFILLRRSRAGQGINAAVEPVRLPLAAPDQATVLTLLVLLPVMNSVARALSNLGFWGGAHVVAGSYWPVALLSTAFFAVLVAATFAYCSNQDVLGRLFVSLVVLLGCLTLFDEASMKAAGFPPLLSDSLVAATENYSHFLFWFVAVVAIRMVDWHPYRLAALTELCMSAVAFVFGLMLQGFDGLARFLVDGALYAVVIIALALLWRMRSVAIETPQVGDVSSVCVRIAGAHGLTPRETEVFTLLAQGRSRVFIQEELSLSDSTIKAHTSHVYQKLGVHSKQELISLVQEG